MNQSCNLAKYLLSNGQEPVSLKVLREAGLMGWAFHRSKVLDPDRVLLKKGVLESVARHALTRTRLDELVKKWNLIEFEPLIIKGFSLSEFVYNKPDERTYGDVDILLPDKDAERIVEIGQECGWIENYRLDNSLGYDHEYSHLFTVDRLVRIDLHLELLQADTFSKKRKRFTDAIRDCAIKQELLGGIIRIPQPVDQAVVLLINRRWGDRWARKATDYTDLLAIKERYSVTREDVMDRAKELGCSRNIALTLETCDPWLKKLKLGRPPRWQQILWDLQCSSELGSYEFDYYAERLRQAPSRIWHVWHSLPHLLEAIRKRKDIQNLELLISQFDSKPVYEGVQPKLSQLFKWSLGVLWASKIIRLRDNPCVPKSLALLRVLSRAGFTASFVSGVRKNNGKLEGHAWIEVDGLPLEADIQAPSLYKENFRYNNWLMRQKKAEAVKPSDAV
jgi:hypothetical protein